MSDHVLDTTQPPRYIVWSIVAIGFLLFVYTAVRAASLTFTIDEIFSLEHIRTHGFELYPGTYGSMSANNHWLNSFFLWLISKISAAPFALRLPQLISHLLFLLFSARIVLLLRKDLFAVGFFILINVHPYLLDFFSLARGYGLSLGCMMTALYFLVCIERYGAQRRHVFLLLVSGTLSVTASFVMLNFFIAAVAVAGLFVILSARTAKQKTILLSIITAGTATLLLIVAPHLLKMREAEALFFGSTGFWSGTVRSLAEKMMYDATPRADTDTAAPAYLLLTGMLLLIVIALIVQLRDGIRSLLRSFTCTFALLCGVILLLLVTQATVFGTLYPVGRTGLFLLPVFVFAFAGAIDQLIRSRAFSSACTMALSVPLLFHFVYRMNNTYVLDWRESGNMDKIFGIIAEDRKTRFTAPEVWVSADPLAGYTLQYICRERNATWLHLHVNWESGPFLPGNYYIAEENMLPYRDMSSSVLLYKDELTGNRLFLDAR
jgi:hypothetical protein